MKLRNKKTGEIIALKDEGELALLKLIENSLPNGLSLWEKIKEPLIKDEKARKVFREWAELHGAEHFRVWSDYWKKYASEAELHMDGSVDAVFEDADGVPHHENTDLVVEFPTGLKDKNGKEIYEGDILGGIWEGGFVSWCEKCKQLQYHSAGIGCMACSGEVHWYEIAEDDGKLEVIGNIHENYELWNGDMKYDYYKHLEPITDQDIINSLQSENAYLRGIIGVYEKFLEDRGYIKEEENGQTQIQKACD